LIFQNNIIVKVPNKKSI